MFDIFDIVLCDSCIACVRVCVCLVNRSISVRAFLNELPGLNPCRDLAFSLPMKSASCRQVASSKNKRTYEMDRTFKYCVSWCMFYTHTRLLSYLLTHTINKRCRSLVAALIQPWTLCVYVLRLNKTYRLAWVYGMLGEFAMHREKYIVGGEETRLFVLITLVDKFSTLICIPYDFTFCLLH